MDLCLSLSLSQIILFPPSRSLKKLKTLGYSKIMLEWTGLHLNGNSICFGIYLMRWQEREVSSFEWRKWLLEKAKPIVHASWLALLKDSVIFDNEVCRVGGIIDYATCEFLPFLPDLIYMFPHMPLYINWGPDRPLSVLLYFPVPHYDDFKAPLPLDAATVSDILQLPYKAYLATIMPYYAVMPLRP
ncbi:hypothetical protein EDD18DRAFT_1107778 [Armillaria luteobubalina]|uniref:Uncharacterized protein n=1 Tax=Armillaria luteobubalina TaxID=153913 RepID=A0AA39UUT7_9AGAR|nr:hypothetical protein EDD18DRAFT_1107778 [Armillaria luteobubalina]